MNDVRVVPNVGSLSHIAGKLFLRLTTGAAPAQRRLNAALSGGSTPRATYVGLARSWLHAPDGSPDWTRVHLFWGDERYVPPDDPQSNYRMAREALIDHVPIPPENVHPVPTTVGDAREAARQYEAELVKAFGLKPGEVPRFDLILLGMGADGHVASLFPGTAALEETKRLVVANWVPALETWRITMTLPVLNHAANVMVLVSGKEKSETLRRVLKGPHTPPLLPAERLKPTNGTLTWLVDRDAAGPGLESGPIDPAT